MKLFVDSSAWLALFDKRDQFHSRAKEALQKIRRDNLRLFTSEYIFIESVTLIRFKVSHTASLQFGQALWDTTLCETLPATSDRLHAAWEIFTKYSDKFFSLVDCTSFALMKELRIDTAFTFDKDFKAAGFHLF